MANDISMLNGSNVPKHFHFKKAAFDGRMLANVMISKSILQDCLSAKNKSIYIIKNTTH